MSSELDNEIYKSLRGEFIEETRDHLDEMEGALNRFFAGEFDAPQTLETLRRLAHTIKGLTGAFGFHRLTTLTHEFEEHLAGRSGLVLDELHDIDAFIEHMRSDLARSQDLPYEEPSVPAPVVVPSAPPPQPSKDEDVRVLVITSSRTISKRITQELEAIGFLVEQVRRTIDGIECAASTQPDIIIVSDILDSLTGIDLVTALVTMPTTAKIPIIYLTSFDDQHPEIVQLPALVPKIFLGCNIVEEVQGALSGIEHRFLPEKNINMSRINREP